MNGRTCLPGITKKIAELTLNVLGDFNLSFITDYFTASRTI